MTKPYRLGILVGRFQVLHLGHEQMIRKAIELCCHVAVFIGSSQESGTNKNPYSYEERKDMLNTVFGDRISVYPLPDIGVGNTAKWGKYVLQTVRACCGDVPDLLISGKETRRIDWFDGEAGAAVAELCIPKTIDISASTLRDCFLRDDEETWRSFTNPLLWDRYASLRDGFLAAKDNLDTKSI